MNNVAATVTMFALLGLAGSVEPECKPKLEIGMSYNEAKVACPDLAEQATWRDNKTHQVAYLCKSQHTYIVGDLRTARMIGFLLTPEWQDTLVIRTQASLDSSVAAFGKEFDKMIVHDSTRDKKKK